MLGTKGCSAVIVLMFAGREILYLATLTFAGGKYR